MTAVGTRETILETAARLFHEQGYHATGISTILREAGVQRASLYHFFGSKEALLVGVLQRYAQGLHAMILAPSEQAADDPVERVFHLIDQYRGFLERTRCAMGCPIGNLALEMADDHRPVREWIERNFRDWAAGITGWLRHSATLPDGVDLEDVGTFVLCTLEGAILLSRASGTLDPYDRCVRELRRYFERLFKSPVLRPKETS